MLSITFSQLFDGLSGETGTISPTAGKSDPIGKKFYESYALGVGNCIAEVKDILAGREPDAV